MSAPATPLEVLERRRELLINRDMEAFADLFAAGVIPALLMTVALMLTGWLIARRRGYATERFPGMRQVLLRLVAALPGLLLVGWIFFGIRAGIFTAVESASIAVVYALIVTSVLYRTLTLQHFLATCAGAVRTTGLILFVIGASASFGWLLAFLQVPAAAVEALTALSDSREVILLLALEAPSLHLHIRPGNAGETAALFGDGVTACVVSERSLRADSLPLVEVELRADGAAGRILQVQPAAAGVEIHMEGTRLAALAISTLAQGACDLLARYATIGGVAAARLRDRGEARRLFRIARRARPDVAKHWVRNVVAWVPPAADHLWEPTDAAVDERGPSPVALAR